MIRNNPAKYRRQVSLQSPTDSEADGWGSAGAAQTWTTYATPFAEVDPYTSREAQGQAGTESSTRYSVRIRYRSDVLLTHRVLYGTKILNIVGVVDVEDQRRETKIDCVEAVQAA